MRLESHLERCFIDLVVSTENTSQESLLGLVVEQCLLAAVLQRLQRHLHVRIHLTRSAVLAEHARDTQIIYAVVGASHTGRHWSGSIAAIVSVHLLELVRSD